MAVRVNLHESTCCHATLKTVSDPSGRYYLACTRCGKEPQAPSCAPRYKKDMILPEVPIKHR